MLTGCHNLNSGNNCESEIWTGVVGLISGHIPIISFLRTWALKTWHVTHRKQCEMRRMILQYDSIPGVVTNGQTH
jgi:hypothetical protein